MYGLGLAEAELGEFIGARPDVVVATKFGIRPTTAGRAAGLVQPPVRRVMQSFPAVKSTAKRSGTKRDAGVIGRLLYSEHDYSVPNARRALTASLRALRNTRLNYFFLHEPAGWLSGQVFRSHRVPERRSSPGHHRKLGAGRRSLSSGRQPVGSDEPRHRRSDAV